MNESPSIGPRPEEELDPELLMAFAPVDKRAFGIAVGLACGLGMAFFTSLSLLLSPGQPGPLALMSQFFAGYSVTWTGALIGAAWGLFVGFIGGWFLAFSRNLAVAAWIFAVRTRAELKATHDFIDHI